MRRSSTLSGGAVGIGSCGAPDEKAESLRQLCDQHSDRVYRFLLGLGLPPAEADSIMQQTSTRAMHSAPNVEKLRDPGFWLRTIAIGIISERRRTAICRGGSEHRMG